jgi:hypothetical protein
MTIFDKTAIVKPDHVGDLILASPAIGRLSEISSEATLFVASQNVSLARHLFPDLEIKALDWPHLAKDTSKPNLSPRALQAAFAPFQSVFMLREDAYLNRPALRAVSRPLFFTGGRPEIHETRRHAECLYGIIGSYESDKYWPGRTLDWPSQIERVGLVVGAGFPTNRWPAWYWARLARLLIKEGRSVLLVGGPSERDFADAIAQLAGLGPEQLFIGSSDSIPTLLVLLGDCDVAVASDGGAGHLASLVCPVLSLFTSSPYRRFAPFGRSNRVIALKLKCSPCMNADNLHVNLCLTHECSFGILPETVLSALEVPSSGPGISVPLKDPYGAELIFGISHA